MPLIIDQTHFGERRRLVRVRVRVRVMVRVRVRVRVSGGPQLLKLSQIIFALAV